MDGLPSPLMLFVTVTAHLMTEEWEIENFVLKTGELRESHTAENVSNCIMDGLAEFGVKWESVVAVTTDNASNYANAVKRHMKTTNIPCFAHTINLAVHKGLGVRSIESSVNKLKRAAAYFNKSTTNSYLLEEKQKALGVNKDKLINDCVTRWNSTHDMICRAVDQQAPLAAVIFDKKLTNLELSTSEWSQLEKEKQREIHAEVLAEMTAIAEKSGGVECTELPVPNQAPNKSALSAMGDLFSQVYQQPSLTICMESLSRMEKSQPTQILSCGGKRQAV
ncbi:hypothetical protein SKAU_G00060860 [Synaphobranchus kaupii]|uniref:Uncharacterized protein n=1 Tax=Synaphobranchus kaupii TaxID=118154 RepID=A0A9Q1G5C7_SYNKA|nr:hypothetical protein SKAU_G00060860 [Synaphobranchus kaupii]